MTIYERATDITRRICLDNNELEYGKTFDAIYAYLTCEEVFREMGIDIEDLCITKMG